MSTTAGGQLQQRPHLSLAPGERLAPRRHWRDIGPEPRTAHAPPTEAAMAAEASIAADRATLEALAAVRAKQDRLGAQAAYLEARLARSAIAHGGSSLQSQSIELRSMAREVASRLTIPLGTARRALDDALTRTSAFPTLVAAQARGVVNARQATTIVDEALILCDGDVTQSQRDRYVADAIDAAPGMVPSKLKIVVRQLAERVASLPITVRHERAIGKRYVAIADAEDGMAYLTAFLPAVHAHAIKDRLDQGADAACTSDPRTREQWRADALAAVLLTGEAADSVHEHCDEASCVSRMLTGITAHIAITVPMLSLAIDDPYYPVQPAMLNGQAPMSLTTAAAFVGDRGAMQRWLTHPVTGQVIAVDTRFANRQLEREVHGRDGSRCRTDTCASTRKLQQDHSTRWADGGATTYGNLSDLCPSCHIVKDNTGWRYVITPEGHLEWASPLGYTSIDRAIPPDLPLDLLHLPCPIPDTG